MNEIEDNLELNREWEDLMNNLEKTLGTRPKDLNGVLFLIGIQELGQGAKTFTKEQKQDLMHIAICRVLSSSGFYELEGHDQDGWPHWKLIKQLPSFDLLNQEKLLKIHVLQYFKDEGIF